MMRQAMQVITKVLRQPGNVGLAACLAVCVVFCAVSISCQTLIRGTSAEPRGVGVRYVREPDIRVRIRSGVASAAIAGPRLLVVRTADRGPTLLATPAKVSIAAGGAVVLTDAAGVTWQAPAGAQVEITSGAPRQPGEILTLKVDDTTYPGALVLMPRTGGEAGLDVINVLPLEIYLPGVSSAELFARWPEETYKAQTVAARTYALQQRERSRAAGRPFDLESTTVDQVYAGLTTNQTAIRAAESTRGLILTHRGDFLRAYYSSTCGGRSASAADTWPTGPGFEYNLAAPIQARPRIIACEASPLFRWEVTRSAEELAERWRAWGARSGSAARTIGTPRSVRAIAHDRQTGRPSRYEIVDVTGRRLELAAEDLRIACNAQTPRRPPPPREQLVRSGDMEFDIRGDTVTIRGRGFGHGVGMCQYCAKGFADQGRTYESMLTLFYPGATLERAY